ncbi:S-layer homology domain-containing protein [Paenibacillus sp. J5C_2022]|uniref:S-layer homology domain-containing protein n=1 Tax=Paenibacillus sp. J5C2022 TaxID=2977129 RepID=UPI0021D0ABEA|nr:S-layer homology domain-containing protein [Paenibacillus sp. J5C2022]MCU6708643.1 S-layer homology domain-containing protein [Paenibacillus sp. J5C2022]
MGLQKGRRGSARGVVARASLLLAIALLAMSGIATTAEAGTVGCGPDRVNELRAAITASNASAAVDTIHLGACDYELSGGPLQVEAAVSLIGSGSGAGGTRLIGNGDRAVVINEHASDSFGDVHMEALSIMNGQAPDGMAFGGAGIFADTGDGTLTLRDVVVSNNRTGNDGSGGGLYVSGPSGGKLVLDRAVIEDNFAAVNGGGLFVDGDIALTIDSTNFQNNVADRWAGGGMAAMPDAGTGKHEIKNSSFIGNEARGTLGGGMGVGGGAAVYAADTVIVNSTFSGNQARDGGGGMLIAANPVPQSAVSPRLSHITMTNNNSQLKPGGGILLAAGSAVLTSSIISGNTAPSWPDRADIGLGAGNVPQLDAASSQYNVLTMAAGVFNGDMESGHNIIVGNAGLLPLADNGGYTPTHALAADSAARSVGGPVTTDSEYDQRGFPRLVDDAAAAGSFEGWSFEVTANNAFSQLLNMRDATDLSAMRSSENPSGLIASDLPLEEIGTNRTLKVTPATGRAGHVSYTLTATRTIDGVPHSLSSTLELEVVAYPDLTVDITPIGSFYQTQTGAQYEIQVANNGIVDTNEAVTLMRGAHSGLTVTGIDTSDGWSCVGLTGACTRSVPLAAGATSTLTVTVDVAANATSPVNLTAQVSGGGEKATSNNEAAVPVQIHTIPHVQSLSVPANAVYKAGDTLAFEVLYDGNVSVNETGGKPALMLDIGGEPKQALYSGGSGTAVLRFAYTIEEGMQDSNGIGLTGLDLNGGTMLSDNGVPVGLALAGVPALGGVQIDAKRPVITTVAVPAAAWYKEGDEWIFQAQFDETIEVTGSPVLKLRIGSSSIEAPFDTHSGSSASFKLTVPSGQMDADGIEMTGLELNGATIKDAAGNAANLALPGSLDTSGIKVDSVVPSITGIMTIVVNGTYSAGAELDFKVSFQEPVHVAGAGTSRLALQIGDDRKYADYVQGSNSQELIYRYTVQSGDLDGDGIAFAGIAPLELNGATIKDAAGNAADISFTALPDISGIIVDATAPAITSVAITPGTYLTGATLRLTVNYDEAVIVTGGMPKLPLTIGSRSVEAAYASGTGSSALVFTYTLEANLEDADGIELAAAVLPGTAEVKDAAGNEASHAVPAPLHLTDVLVDTVVPVVQSVALIDGVYRTGDELAITVTYSEAVEVDAVNGTPFIAFRIGGTGYRASYDSGSGTNALKFLYTVAVNDGNGESVDLSGAAAIELNGGTVKDASGNAAALTLSGIGDTSEVVVDSTIPAMTGMTVPADGTYVAGDVLTFRVTVSEPAAVNTTGGKPLLQLDMGGIAKEAQYDGTASSPTELVFAYEVQSGDLDGDGIAFAGIAPLELNGATIKDAAGNAADISFTALPDISGIIVDATAPNAVEADIPLEGIYKAGEKLEFHITVSEPVVVHNIGGTPSIELIIGGTTVQAEYAGSSAMPTDKLTFVYTIAEGVNDEDGIEWGTTMKLNGGAIADAAGNALMLSLPSVDLSGIHVDTKAPDAPVFTITDGEAFFTRNPMINGTAEAGSEVTVTAVDLHIQGVATTAADGTWSIELVDVPLGKVELFATATDAAGNVSEESSMFISVQTIGSVHIPWHELSVIRIVSDAGSTSYAIAPEQARSGHKVIHVDTDSETQVNISRKVLNDTLAMNKDFALEVRNNRGSVLLSFANVKKAFADKTTADMETITLKIGESDKAVHAKVQQIAKRLGARTVISPVTFTVQYRDMLGEEGGLDAEEMLSLSVTVSGEKPVEGSILAQWDEIAQELKFISSNFQYDEQQHKWYVQSSGHSAGTYMILNRPVAFPDLADHWSRHDVELLASMLIIEGRSDSRFDPESSITRAEFTSLLSRILGLEAEEAESPFSDVNGRWYEKAVTGATNAGIVTGYQDGTFRPNAVVTRQEMAIMIVRTLRYLNIALENTDQSFNDQDDIADWAEEAVQLAAAAGIVRGDEQGNYQPADYASRAEAAVMLIRLMRYSGLSIW